MNAENEWEELKARLRGKNYSSDGFKNQFFKRLLTVLGDAQSNRADQLLLYRDALLASPDPGQARLTQPFAAAFDNHLLKRFGLGVGPDGLLASQKKCRLYELLRPVYQLEARRHIKRFPMDPALLRKLNDKNYSQYNGVAQQLATRLAVTAPPRATLVVNLPTGCGKTLVAHAMSLFASDRQLTVVVVPTIGLAIEHGVRAKKMLDVAGLDQAGIYYWHGQQTSAEHDGIRQAIREQRQRVLFCSPEAACMSLLPTLFATARADLIGSIVVDEAHIVDQWGAEFRPYFQILAALVRSLRGVSRNGFRCVLMSATFTENSGRLVEELFAGGDCTYIDGSFLRPEIQYHVEHVRPDEHLERVIDSIIGLPKPLIVYTVTQDDARRIDYEVRRLGLTRRGLFTGATSASERGRLLDMWAADQLDIMIATSAFGLGMDKGDVRSVLHAAVPENLDRFYQEVGRSGRDGRASQSLLIYNDQQVDTARDVNRQRLITVDLGLEKWKTMWVNGKESEGGRRKVAISAIRHDQQNTSEANEEWNWRTLLLMQRAGMIRIELAEPKPPSIQDSFDADSRKQQLDEFYEEYYSMVDVVPLVDHHLDRRCWEEMTGGRRESEKEQRNRGLDTLLQWIRSPEESAICDVLGRFYTFKGNPPEHACGGCPKCRQSRLQAGWPTLGSNFSTNAPKPNHWSPPINGRALHRYVYFSRDDQTQKRIVRSWRGWIGRLIDSGSIQSIRAGTDVLNLLETELALVTNRFWIGEQTNNFHGDGNYWPQLVLHLDASQPLPSLGWADTPKILIAPAEQSDAGNARRLWYESVQDSISLDTFLIGLNHGNH
jgi:ATP-dependent DNA helicase RecQ